MHFLSAHGAGHHLHRSTGLISQAGNLDFGKPRVPGWKQRGIPSKQACLNNRRLTVCRCIDYHLDNTFNVPIHRRQSADIDVQASCDADADGSDIQLLALDLAGFDDILGQCQ